MGELILLSLLGLPSLADEDVAALLLVSAFTLGLLLVGIVAWAWTEHRGQHRRSRVVRRDSGLLTRRERKATYLSRHALAGHRRIKEEARRG